jgi:DNA helicase II / ATP-dependent DNA helicase PcrA
MELNKYQKEAVEHTNGPCLVTSCPGSGKTFCIVERTIQLINSGVKPKNMLLLTFTNKAGAELKERVCKKLGVDDLGFFVGTFHSFCVRIIRKLGGIVGYNSNFTILDEKDQSDLAFQISRRLSYNIEYGEAKHVANCLNYYRDQLEDFDWVENILRTKPLIHIAQEYLDHCRKNSLIDFSGLIYEAINIIENNDEVRQKLQNIFKYIMVDESQDTNKSQFHLVNLLAGETERNVMLISDVDQSIYAFRGARYQNIQDFINRYDDCRVISLSKNYRSTKNIIEACSKLIKHNDSHMDISFETDNEEGEPVRCYAFKNQYTEADWVAKTAKRFIDNGWDASKMFVIYRINKMAEPIEQSMANYGVPYETVGSWSFYDRKEIRDCLAMLKFLSNPKDGIAFGRICSIIPGLGNITIGKIENFARHNDINIIEACKRLINTAKTVSLSNSCNKIVNIYNNNWDYNNPSLCLQEIVEQFGYNKYLEEKFGKSAGERIENVGQLIDSAGRFAGEEKGLIRFLQQISLATSSDKDKKENCVYLMSMHAAKGLEADVVFTIGIEDGISPSRLALADDVELGLEEERRCLYVALSRARKVLITTYCKTRKMFGKYGSSKDKKCKPSQFLYEAGLLKQE